MREDSGRSQWWTRMGKKLFLGQININLFWVGLEIRLKLFGALGMPLVLSALTGLQIAAAAQAHRSLDEHLCHRDALRALWQHEWAAPTCSSTLHPGEQQRSGTLCRKSPAKCFYFSFCGLAGEIGCVWQWTVLHLAGNCTALVARVVLAALWKAALPNHFWCRQFPNAPVDRDKFPKCNWIGQILQDLGSSLCLLDWPKNLWVYTVFRFKYFKILKCSLKLLKCVD